MSRQTETAYQYIKQKIFDGTFKPSQKLIESQLAEWIGVSRNTVKKALLKLEQEHLVEIEDNKGATIKSYTLEEVVHYLEILEALECLVMKDSTTHIKEHELARLEEIVDKMEMFLQQNRFDEYSALSMDFREIIYQATKNRQAVEMIRALRAPLRRFQFRTILLPGIKENSIKEHRRIYESIKKRDECEAEAAIRSDLRIVRQNIQQNYHLLF